MTEEENNAAEDVEELILFLLEYDNNFSIQLKCHLHHVWWNIYLEESTEKNKGDHFQN